MGGKLRKNTEGNRGMLEKNLGKKGGKDNEKIFFLIF